MMIVQIIIVGILIILLGILIILFKQKLEDIFYKHSFSIIPTPLTQVTATGWAIRGGFIIFIGIIVSIVGLLFS